MSSATMGTHSGAGPLGLMSCVRESSPLQDFDSDTEKSVTPKKRFWNPKKWFRRKNKGSDDVQGEVADVLNNKDTLRSRSASELSIADEQIRKRSSSSMHPGLSVSHDSVFHSPHSGSENDLDAAQSSSSLSIPQPQADLELQTELTERLRLRRTRGDLSEDEGLPCSPCNSPGTTNEPHEQSANKDLSAKSHSTCGNGSLLSMGSSEIEEDSYGQQSKHASKLSIHDKKITDQDPELELGSLTAPLNHSAAHHKVSVRPKRTHGIPRRNHRVPQLTTALPSTPEVNEDSSINSLTSEVITNKSHSEIITESCCKSTKVSLIENQLKCSSLPPGATVRNEENLLNRSLSNAGSKKDDGNDGQFGSTKKNSISLFERIMPRRSGKKKKNIKEEKITVAKESGSQDLKLTTVEGGSSSRNTRYSADCSVTSSYSHVQLIKRNELKPVAAPRSGAATRQRIQPINIPASPEVTKRPSPEKILSSSPLHMELESHFKNQHKLISSSPPKNRESLSTTPPTSPKSPTASEPIHFIKSNTVLSSSRYAEAKREALSEDVKSNNKMKIVGLSSLQEKILSLTDETDNDKLEFKSLTTASVTNLVKKPIVKSHSFKSVKPEQNSINDNKSDGNQTNLKQNRKSFTKAISLDSIKTLEADPKETSPNKLAHLTDFIISETQQAILKNHEKELSKNDLPPEHKIVELINPKVITGTLIENSTLSKGLYENNHEIKFESKTRPISLTKSRKNSLDHLLDEKKASEEITISGPSHTAVVNVSKTKTVENRKQESSETTTATTTNNNNNNNNNNKEQKVSITNIQVKREVLTSTSQESTVSSTLMSKTHIPEFMNRQLNKVETKPASTVVCSIKSSPRTSDDQSMPKTLDLPENSNKSPPTRKFSKENIEIIVKDAEEKSIVPTPMRPIVSISSMTPPVRFRKNEPSKTSIMPESVKKDTTKMNNRSSSLDSLQSSSQDSLDNFDEKPNVTTVKVNETVEKKHTPDTGSCVTESIVPRKKSVILSQSDDQPELMKVFARRSLKLKDSDTEILSQQVAVMVENKDSDKENHNNHCSTERKKSITKEPLSEIKPEVLIVETKKKQVEEDKTDNEVVLRNPSVNNKFAQYQRTVSLQPIKSNDSSISSNNVVKKQQSFHDRRKTDHWLSNIKNEEFAKTGEDQKFEIITEELITESKNFNQRKAIWEKRAQEGQKKSVP